MNQQLSPALSSTAFARPWRRRRWEPREKPIKRIEIMKTRSAMLVALILGVSALNSAAQEGWGGPPWRRGATGGGPGFGPGGSRQAQRQRFDRRAQWEQQGDFRPARRNFDRPVGPRAQAQRDGFGPQRRGPGPMGPPRFEGGPSFGPRGGFGPMRQQGWGPGGQGFSPGPGFGPRRFGPGPGFAQGPERGPRFGGGGEFGRGPRFRGGPGQGPFMQGPRGSDSRPGGPGAERRAPILSLPSRTA